NGGIREQAELVPLQVDDLEGLVQFAKTNCVDLTFVGPEVPLSKGIVDVFRRHGFSIIGPTADNSRLESSKIFAKQFFKANGIPTAAFFECATPAEAYDAIRRFNYPMVIKEDGLAAGKGVIIAEDANQAQTTIQQFMESKTLGEAGSR